MDKLFTYLVNREIGFKTVPYKNLVELHLIDNFDDSDVSAIVEMTTLIYRQEGRIVIILV
jgi:hypothetical protein